MRYEIPIKPVPSQKVIVTINGKRITISLRTMAGRLFFSMTDSDTTYVVNSYCADREPLIRAPYAWKDGDFYFADQYGTDNPVFTELGSRFYLIYDNGE